MQRAKYAVSRTGRIARLGGLIVLFAAIPFVAAASTLAGVVWSDDDGDAIADRGEPGLPGVTIYLDLDLSKDLSPGDPRTVSQADDPRTLRDETGSWALESAPGNVTVRVDLGAGAHATFPIAGAHNVQVAANQDIQGLDFGVYDPSPSTLHGTIWSDDDGDGRRDSAERGLAGVTIYSDLNFNGVYDDATEPSTVSMRDDRNTNFDESGLYWLEVGPGIHLISTVAPDETLPSFPDGGGHRIAVAPGVVIEDLDFGFQALLPGTAHGRVWLDHDADGTREPGERGLAGVTIYLDANRNGRFEGTEPSTVTMADNPNTDFDEAGLWWLTVDPGSHLFRSITPMDALATFPPDGHLVDVGPSDGVDGLDYGFVFDTTGTIAGRVYRDSNQDGVYGMTEPGIGGPIVYVDENENCEYDAGEPATRAMHDDPATFFDEAGLYWLAGLDPGWHTVRVISPLNHFPLSPTSGALFVYAPLAGIAAGRDFGLGSDGGYWTKNPDHIEIESLPGAMTIETVEVAFQPYCIRAIEMTVEASDPFAMMENLSGTQINGCGGDTSSFDVRFTAPDGQQCYQLVYRDAEFGGVLTSIPVKVVPEPGLGAALAAGAIALLAAGSRRRA